MKDKAKSFFIAFPNGPVYECTVNTETSGAALRAVAARYCEAGSGDENSKSEVETLVSYEEVRDGQKPPHTFIIRVKFQNKVNYTPLDVVRRWGCDNYTPVYFDDYFKPFLFLYNGRYMYDHWKITDNGDGTETVAATLLRQN